jgi:hypothetical protein
MQLVRSSEMAYQLLFFCRAGEETGHAALERLLDELLVRGPLLGEWLGPYPEAAAGYELASMSPDGKAVADYLTIEILVGVAMSGFEIGQDARRMRYLARTRLGMDIDQVQGWKAA